MNAPPRSSSAGLRRIGVLGGSFDPVHLGHLRLARLARRRFQLDRVYFLPARRPWHKPRPQADFHHRFAMLALALCGLDWAVPAALPDRGRPSFTWDELAWVHLRHPRARLFFLLGADAFHDLPHWHKFPALLDRCDWIVAHRGSLPLSATEVVPAAWLRQTRRQGLRLRHSSVWWLPRFNQPFSSSGIRRLARARSLSGLSQSLPPRVAEYALRAGLY